MNFDISPPEICILLCVPNLLYLACDINLEIIVNSNVYSTILILQIVVRKLMQMQVLVKSSSLW